MSEASAGLRLHPAGLLIGLIAGLPNLALPIVAIFVGTRGSSAGLAIIIPLILGVFLLSFFFRWLAWTRFRYIIDDEDIRIESGIINRNARSIPFERIQDVSIEQRLLARIMGLGAVKFETGGGEGEDAKLAFVSMAEGARLREVIKARKDNTAPAAESPASDSEDSVITENADPAAIFAMDIKRVLTFGLFEFSLVIFAVFLGLAQQFEFLLPFDIFDPLYWTGLAEDSGVTLDGVGWTARILGLLAALIFIIFLGIATGVIRTFTREYGFRLDRTEKGFRRRRGLTTLTDVVMPIHRVQAAIIHTGIFREKFGWQGLKFVSLAQDNKEEASHAVAPFARRDEVSQIAKQAGITLPDADCVFRRPSGHWWLDKWLVIFALLALGLAAVAVISGRFIPASVMLQTIIIPTFASAALVALIMWLDWRHNGYARDGHLLYTRTGWWSRKMTAMQQVKIQSVEIRQGPISRLRGLAKIHFGVAGGQMSIPGLPIDMAKLMREEALDHIVRQDFSSINAA